MMIYKLLALDMDGTLLNKDKRISEGNHEWIRRAADAGITVCMATGRGQPHIVPFMEQLGLQTPFVAVNGSEVWRSTDTILSRAFIDLDEIRALHTLAEEHDVWYWAYGSKQVYNKENWLADIGSEQWMKFCYYTEERDVLRTIIDQIKSLGIQLEMTNSDPRNIEFNPLGVNKATGLEQICQLLGYRMDEVVAVGDSLNDLAMIEQAGLGIAMGNAQEAVKDAADAITLTNEEDGVAEVIRRYLL